MSHESNGNRGPESRRWVWPLLLAAAWLLCPGAVLAAQRAELTRLVDSPTAGLVEKGKFGFELRLFHDGGLMGRLSAGALKRLTISVSYGGERIIGDRQVDWYPRLEPDVRYRLIEESETWPALVVGYETQGYGAYADERYQVKSKGIFVSLSKNYLSGLGQFGLHGGVSLTREDGDDEGPSGWLGADKEINEDLILVGEYDLALDDDGEESLGTGEGYLNAGLRWAPAPQLTIGFYLKNLLGSGPGDPRVSRELSVLYAEEF